MVKMTRAAAITALVGLAFGISTLLAQPARAVSTSDKPASILFWPKIVVDSNSASLTDTKITLANANTTSPTQAHCFYVDANSHCSNNPTVVCKGIGNECGAGACVAGWMEIDFNVVLTPEQPLVWSARDGLSRSQVPLKGYVGICAEAPVTCTGPMPGCTCIFPPSNAGTGVPPVPEPTFVGSLECIQYAAPIATAPARPDNAAGAVSNLIGQATIEYGTAAGVVDVASYNAPGLRFLAPAAGVPLNELHLDNSQYDSCPTSLVLDHVFDNVNGSPSANPLTNTTELTLVPCGNNFAAQVPGSATAQFLVFNEFEQRFSTTRSVPCFLDSQISRLDTSFPTRSIFSWNISGTAAGQTRIRPVGTASTGRGLLGVALLRSQRGSAAYALQGIGNPSFGVGTQPDVITLP